MLTGLKLENGVVTSLVVITGGGACDVDARIFSTFGVKKAANSSRIDMNFPAMVTTFGVGVSTREPLTNQLLTFNSL